MGEPYLRVLILIAFNFLLLWRFSSSQDQQCHTMFGSLTSIEADAYKNLTLELDQSGKQTDVSDLCKTRGSQNTAGIECCCNNLTATCNIVTLDLSSRGLMGTIPEAISSFTYLNSLDLSYNKIEGAIPDSLGDLSFLTRLNLRVNQLNGSIPKSLGKLKNLMRLQLSGNFLNGSIPPSFAALEHIIYLDASTNNLSGSIPPFLGNLTSLRYLDLDTNQFNGTLPPELGNLKNLTSLELWSNSICGPIPDEYAPLTSLSIFDVGGNNISGQIPSFFKNWTKLTDLYLFGNKFEGKIPPELFELSSIETLWISDVRNSGFQFPLSANLTSIESLMLRNCSISGVIPHYVGTWKNLEYLDLSFNNIAGGVPVSFQHLNSLSEMLLAGNKLNGTFPYWVIEKESLMVDLSYNTLQVNESFKVHNVSNTNVFDCCSTDSTASNEVNMNSLSQSMESSCPNDKSKRNHWHINCGGEEEKLPLNHYHADNVSSNYYSSSEGKWAYSCSGATSASSYDAIKKAKCGVVDSNAPLYDSARYCPVSLTYYVFCLQNGNYQVELFFYELVYKEVEDYSILNDRVFDIYIQGILQWKDFNIIDVAGCRNQGWSHNFSTQVSNSSLKIQLFWAGKGAFDENGPLISAISAIAEQVDDGKLSTLHIVMIALASAVFALLLLLLLIWKLCWSGKGELNERYIEILGRSFTVQQIVDATRNFSPKMEIGRGGFGAVYRVKICPRTFEHLNLLTLFICFVFLMQAELLNQIVAVKKLSTSSIQGMGEFKNEVYTLKTLKHENLVQLLDGYAEKDILLLIYEYMEYNSLSRALFESTIELNWETRFSICLGVAKGLKYLHEDSRIKIVHRDIKASNILLDGNLKPKISDFGLARLYDKNENQNMITIVGGTRGYMAPEYAMRGILTDKADIYSYGVLILEIVSGKNNADYKMNQESVFLLDTAYVLHKRGSLMDLVDTKLERYNVEQARTVLSLGMICTSQSPTLRPTISEVVSVLEGHKTIEQVSADRAPTPGSAADYDRNFPDRDTCFTDISYTSTDVPSGSSTAYYVIKEKDEKVHPPADIYPNEITSEASI